MREKTLSGMMAAAGGTSVEDTIRQKSVSDIHVAVQTTTEERLVPLPVSDDNNCLVRGSTVFLLKIRRKKNNFRCDCPIFESNCGRSSISAE